MKFLDLFAGIGGFRLGMESAGHECVGFCEIDKFARKSYKAIHDTKGEIELHDITTVSDESIRRIGRVDAICGGFPCQAFSIAGNRRGFEDTRGSLFFEIARFASILRPRYLFLENVKGLLNHENGITFETIISTLDELGYDVEWQVLNSKDFGVPQNRERVFIIGHLRGECTRRVFPFKSNGAEVDIQNEQSTNTLTARYAAAQSNGSYIIEGEQKAIKLKKCRRAGQEVEIIQRNHGYNKGNKHEIAPTLTSNSYYENNFLKIREATAQGNAEAEIGGSVNLAHPNSKTRRGRIGKGQANTLLTGESQGVVTSDFRIRKLTPRECWRLQGFPDWAFDKAQEVNSNSQLYKQAGNSVTVSVIAAIAKELG